MLDVRGVDVVKTNTNLFLRTPRPACSSSGLFAAFLRQGGRWSSRWICTRDRSVDQDLEPEIHDRAARPRGKRHDLRPSKGAAYCKPRFASPANPGWHGAVSSTLSPPKPICGSGKRAWYCATFPGPRFRWAGSSNGTAIAGLPDITNPLRRPGPAPERRERER